MIACKECLKIPLHPFPGERVVRIMGIAKKPLLCDFCYPYKEIKIGDMCVAESMGREGCGIPYYEWESEYIEVISRET